MKTNGNESAYPTQMWDEEQKEATWIDGGLTKREYAAVTIASGLVSSGRYKPYDITKDAFRYFKLDVARDAVRIADALIEALGKEFE